MWYAIGLSKDWPPYDQKHFVKARIPSPSQQCTYIFQNPTKNFMNNVIIIQAFMFTSHIMLKFERCVIFLSVKTWGQIDKYSLAHIYWCLTFASMIRTSIGAYWETCSHIITICQPLGNHLQRLPPLVLCSLYNQIPFWNHIPIHRKT